MYVYIRLLCVAFFWGGTFIAGKLLAQNIGPFSVSFLRFTVAGTALFLITRKVEGKIMIPPKRQLLPVFLLGMTGVFAYNVFFLKGLKIIEAGRAAIIIANNPILIAVLSAFFFKEKLNPLKITGIILSICGAIIVISRGNPLIFFNRGLGLGELYIFCCVLSWVTFTLIGKTVMRDMTALTSVLYSSVIGAAALFIPACLEGLIGDMIHYSGMDWANIFYLGFFGTVIGFVWYYDGVKRIGPTKAGVFINFVPVSAIVLAYWLLSEPVTLSLIIGAVFVVSGVFLTNFQPGGAGRKKISKPVTGRRR